MAVSVLTLFGSSLMTKSGPPITPRTRTLRVLDWAIGVTFLMQAFTSGSAKAYCPSPLWNGRQIGPVFTGVRAQARQAPHYLDQLLISQHQSEQPADTAWPTEFPRRDPRIATNEISAIDTKGTQIYWTDMGGAGTYSGSIRRANLDGTNVQDLVTGLGRPKNIALDIEGGKMYWTDANEDKIRRANLDGTDVQDLVTGLGFPFGIALDIEGGKMYWTDASTGKIQCANLDGTDVQEFVTGLEWPLGIALDAEGGKIYWTDAGSVGTDSGSIRRANLDGTNVQDLVTGLGIALAIALDVEGGKMYWAEGTHRQNPVCES